MTLTNEQIETIKKAARPILVRKYKECYDPVTGHRDMSPLSNEIEDFVRLAEKTAGYKVTVDAAEFLGYIGVMRDDDVYALFTTVEPTPISA